jgi:putative FmdB family regulatory protein
MPIYGYACGRCSHEFEILQSMSAPKLRDCPECGGELRKLLYPVGVRFKGTGFYSTDYKSSGNGAGKSDAKGEEGSDSSTSSNNEGSSSVQGAKPAASPEKKAEPAGSKE